MARITVFGRNKHYTVYDGKVTVARKHTLREANEVADALRNPQPEQPANEAQADA